jgi:hypothetical protein
MKALVCLLAFVTANLFGQGAVVVVIVTTPGDSSQTPTPSYQDPLAKIIGNISGGLDLPPYARVIDDPYPWYVYSWGPRSYTASGKLLNVSARAYVAAGRPLISGFVVSQGGRIVLIRAVGPTLATFGVPTVLARPRLELFDGTGKSVAVAVPWSTTNGSVQKEIADATASVGGFGLQTGSQDAVLLAVLDPGNYSCVVSGVSETEGNVLLEAYDVPPKPLPPPSAGVPVVAPDAGV